MPKKFNQELDHSHRNRFADPLNLHQRYESLVLNNENRQRHQNFIMAYKRYPYPLKNGKTEPNLGQFQFLIDKAIDRYVDIITERNRWYDITTLEGTEKESSEWSKSITRWFHHYCIFPWDNAEKNSYKDAYKMQMFGVGIEYWDNPVSLYPEHKDNSEFYPDSNAGMEPETWDILFVRERYTLTELFDEVKNKKTADLNGWNRPAVMNAIKDACGDEFKGVASREVFNRFLKGEVAIETDDTEIYLVDAYIKEYEEDGEKRISRFTFTEEGEIVEGMDAGDQDTTASPKKFLRMQDRLYKDFCNISAIRSDNITDAFYDMSSFAESIYVYCRFYDKAMNKVIRQAIRKGNVYLNSNNPDEQKRISQLDHEEEFIVLPPETTISETNLRGGDTKALTEAIRQLKIDTEAGSGAGLVTGTQNVKGRAITAKEAELQSTENSSTTVSKHKVFAANDSGFGRELYRRFIEQTVPGSKEAKNKKRFLDKMKELEIPKEAYDPENVIIRSIINPSAASPTAKLQAARVITEALNVYAAAGTEGERRAAKGMIAAVTGWQNVAYYIPEQESEFEEDQAYKVGRENSDLDDPHVNPQNVKVRSDDVHQIHMMLHVEDMAFKLDIAEQILKSLEELPSQQKLINTGKVVDILKAQDNKGAHVEAHMRLYASAANGFPVKEQALNAVKKRLGEVRAKESQLEGIVAKIIQQESANNPSAQSQELQHKQQMNELEYNHTRSMMDLSLQERMQKTFANAQGAEVNQQQKLRQKEEEHQQNLRQSSEEEKNESTG